MIKAKAIFDKSSGASSTNPNLKIVMGGVRTHKKPASAASYDIANQAVTKHGPNYSSQAI